MAARAEARDATRRPAGAHRAAPTVRGLLSLVALVVVVIGWVLLLRPTALGGPATFVVVSGSSMEPGMHTGDLVVLRARESYAVGDVVTYRVPEGAPGAGRLVIHRVVGGSASDGFVTQGDNRDRVDEWRPTADEVEGSEWVHVPGAGAAIVRLTEPPLLAALAGGMAVVAVMLGDSGTRGAPGRDGRRQGRARRVTGVSAEAGGAPLVAPEAVAASGPGLGRR